MTDQGGETMSVIGKRILAVVDALRCILVECKDYRLDRSTKLDTQLFIALVHWLTLKIPPESFQSSILNFVLNFGRVNSDAKLVEPLKSVKYHGGLAMTKSFRMQHTHKTDIRFFSIIFADQLHECQPTKTASHNEIPRPRHHARLYGHSYGPSCRNIPSTRTHPFTGRSRTQLEDLRRYRR